MNDLLDIPDSTPPWKLRAENLGIETSIPDGERWLAEIEMFGVIEHESGDTEREAVNALIYRLKL